jgi:hypothetical protein
VLSQNPGKSQVRSKTSQVRRNAHGIRIEINNHVVILSAILVLKSGETEVVAKEITTNLVDKETPVPVVIEIILKGN